MSAVAASDTTALRCLIAPAACPPPLPCVRVEVSVVFSASLRQCACVSHGCVAASAGISRDRMVHHTSFLFDYNPRLMQLLKLPERRPEYRHDRPHSSFLTSLRASSAGAATPGTCPCAHRHSVNSGSRSRPPFGPLWCYCVALVAQRRWSKHWCIGFPISLTCVKSALPTSWSGSPALPTTT